MRCPLTACFHPFLLPFQLHVPSAIQRGLQTCRLSWRKLTCLSSHLEGLFSHLFSYTCLTFAHSCHSLCLKPSFPISSPDPLPFMFQVSFKSCLWCVVFHDLVKLAAPFSMLPGFLEQPPPHTHTHTYWTRALYVSVLPTILWRFSLCQLNLYFLRARNGDWPI